MCLLRTPPPPPPSPLVPPECRLRNLALGNAIALLLFIILSFLLATIMMTRNRHH